MRMRNRNLSPEITRFLAVLGVCGFLLPMGASAALEEHSAYWKLGDGSLGDPTKNSVGRELNGTDYLYFQHTTEGAGIASRVTIPDGQHLDWFKLENVTSPGWTGTAGQDDSCAVTFVGPAKLWLSEWRYPGVTAGRTLIMDNVQIDHTNHLEISQQTGGLTLDGRLLMKNGSGWTATTTAMYSSVHNGGELTMKDTSYLDLFSFEAQPDAKLRFLSGTVTTPHWPKNCYQTNVVVRNAKLHIYANLYSPSFFPSGKDGLYECTLVSDNSLSPTLAGGEQIALRGKAMATNNTDATVSKCILTNDVAFYGRGTLNTGFLRLMNGRTFDFDLANLELGFRIDAMSNPSGATDSPVVSFRNTAVTMYDTRPGKTGTADFTLPVRFFGDTSIDSHDIYAGDVRKMSFNHQLVFQDRAGATFRGDVTLGYTHVPARFSHYALGDDTKVTERDYNYSVPCWRRTHAYALGKNAIHNIQTYEEVVDVASDDVKVDPTATLIAGMQSDVGTSVWPVFCSLCDGPLACNVQVSKEWPGASIKWVGGCAYYSTGTKDYGGRTTQGFWLGGESGSWKTSANWGGNQYPYYGGVDANFCGESNTIVTIDMDNAGVLSCRFTGGAPFIIRGKPMKIYRTASAINSSSPFPAILECPIVANGDLECQSLASQGKGLIVLKGDVSGITGKFTASGNVAVGSNVPCAEVMLAAASQQLYVGYETTPTWHAVYTNFTELTVLKGGAITASAQATANNVAGSIWIDKGGSLTVAGRWDWTAFANEHQVNGLLDLSGATVGGDATQGYFGTGLVRIGTTDGTAAVKLGEKITLETTAANWGTMPIEMTSGITISNRTDWTYAVPGGIRVTGPGHALTVDTAAGATTTFATGIAGYDFDIVKKGAGKLVLAGDLDGLKRGTLDLREGTVAFDGALKVTTLTAASGTALEFGSTDGTAASLFVDDDVDLSKLTFKAAKGDEDALARYRTVLTVPWDCEITGAPTVDGLKLRTIVNADGSKSLQAKMCRGLVIFVR